MDEQVSQALREHVGGLTIDDFAAELHEQLEEGASEFEMDALTNRLGQFLNGENTNSVKAACLNILIDIAEQEHAGCVANENPLTQIIGNVAGGN